LAKFWCRRSLQTWSTAVAVEAVLELVVPCLSEACKLGILQSPVAVVLEGQVLASQTGSTVVGCSFGTVDGSSLLSERVVSSVRPIQRLMSTQVVYHRYELLDAQS